MRMLCAALAVSLGSAAPAATPTLTIAEARALPAGELAHRILGAAGALYTEVQRPGPHAGNMYPVGGRIGLTGLQFASAPSFSGFPGLCEADVVSVSFRASPPASDDNPDPPALVRGIGTHMRYRIMGPAEPVGVRRERDEQRADRACSASGPVLEGEAATRRFFTGTAFGVPQLGRAHAAFAARAFQKAQAAVRRGSMRPGCTPNSDFGRGELCTNPVQLVASLDAGSVHSFALERCAPNHARLCVHARFRMPYSTFLSSNELILSIETDAATIDPGRQRLEVRSVRLHGESWVV